jgi:hypothetical protein
MASVATTAMSAVAVPTGASRGILLACLHVTRRPLACFSYGLGRGVCGVFELFGSFLVEDVTMADWVCALCRGLIGLAKTVPGQASATMAS